ncbi:iron-siderophore ABC transporter substrate-binding protein [Myceligenerans halotolerans]
MTLLDTRRRGPAPAAVALAVTLALSACAGGGEPAATGAATPTTHEIEDYFGTVEIPADPQRVVAADPVSLNLMLALGVQPVAASFNPNSIPEHLGGQADGIVNIAGAGGGFEPDLEAALAQEPDLIVVAAGYTGEGDEAWNKQTYDQATASGVPTFGFAYDDGVSLDDVRNGVTEVAGALGKAEEGERLLANLEERMAGLADRVEAAGLSGKPVSAVRLSDGGNYSIRVGTGESIVFRALGVAQPEGQRDPSMFRIELSEENLDLLEAADTIFVYVDDNAAAEREEFISSPLWPTLPAVEAGRVHWVNSGVWNSSDPVGLGKILDDIETSFIEPAE